MDSSLFKVWQDSAATRYWLAVPDRARRDQVEMSTIEENRTAICHSTTLFLRFQLPTTPIDDDDRNPMVNLANSQAKIGHQRVNHLGGDALPERLIRQHNRTPQNPQRCRLSYWVFACRYDQRTRPSWTQRITSGIGGLFQQMSVALLKRQLGHPAISLSDLPLLLIRRHARHKQSLIQRQ